MSNAVLNKFQNQINIITLRTEWMLHKKNKIKQKSQKSPVSLPSLSKHAIKRLALAADLEGNKCFFALFSTVQETTALTAAGYSGVQLSVHLQLSAHFIPGPFTEVRSGQYNNLIHYYKSGTLNTYYHLMINYKDGMLHWLLLQYTFCVCVKNQMKPLIWPDVRGLLSKLCGHKREVLPHLDPQVGFGNTAVVRMDGVDTSHLPGYQSKGDTKVKASYIQQLLILDIAKYSKIWQHPTSITERCIFLPG